MSFLKLKTIVALSAVVLIVGCNKTETAPQAQEGSRTKIRVGYIGITCEAPIFCAVENGFFKEEGLDVELVK
jgi:NitT/TauT family transport system substrate-binding protein